MHKDSRLLLALFLASAFLVVFLIPPPYTPTHFDSPKLTGERCLPGEKRPSFSNILSQALFLQDTAQAACIPRPSFTLTATKAGTGSGTVTSNPSGITCGAGCTNSYHIGTPVSLTATAGTGSVFAGWSGGGCVGTGSCTVTMHSNITVTATFDLPALTLFVSKAGAGTGTITSSPAGIDCGADCSEPYSNGTVVTLTASAASGYSFTGWSGAGCTGTGTCTVTITDSKWLTASFSLAFTDDPLTSQLTTIKAVHITELRQAINNLRSNNGLTAFSFADPTLTAGVTQVRGVHVTELRTALSGVYSLLGAAHPAYTDPSIPAGLITIKKAHIAEIRDAVRAVEQP